MARVKRAVIVPDAPALVPALGGADSALLNAVRAACLRAVGEDTRGSWVAVGTGDAAAAVTAHSTTPLRGYGRERIVTGQPVTGNGLDNACPPVVVTSWLAHSRGLGELSVELLDAQAEPHACVQLGERLSTADNLLVLGSGTFTWEPGDGTDHSEHAIDVAVHDALATGDRDALLHLDPAMCRRTHVQGRAPWQALAGASAGRVIRPRVLYSEAPFGVRYHVATWDLS